MHVKEVVAGGNTRTAAAVGVVVVAAELSSACAPPRPCRCHTRLPAAVDAVLHTAVVGVERQRVYAVAGCCHTAVDRSLLSPHRILAVVS